MRLAEKKGLKDEEKIEAVLKILREQAPLTLKQEKFCNDACIERFLHAKSDNVKKTAKHLRAVLSWRDAIGIEHLIADEFSAELADGVAYVAGHDDEARPVMVFRMKQDYPKLHSQKSFIRLLVFTLEVAISSMSRLVNQLVLIFDASFFKSAPAFLNLFMHTLKIISDYYPGQLHKAFIVNPPSLFSCLWKGARPFVELSEVTSIVWSQHFEDSLEDLTFTLHPGTALLRRDQSTTTKSVGSISSRFSVTVSHFNSLKPWYLSTTANRAVVPEDSPSLIGVSPLNARSFSFASPCVIAGSRSLPSTPFRVTSKPPCHEQKLQAVAEHPRTIRPSFLQSPAMFLSMKREAQVSRGGRDKESFLPFLKFYRRPYDEMIYRAKMLPPLGGLSSIVSSSFRVNRHAATLHNRRALVQ